MSAFSLRYRALGAILFGCLCLPRPVHAQAPYLQPVLDELIQEALKTWEVPGAAVVLVRGERILYLKGFGVRQLGSKDPVTPETVFALASCTKAFTSLALAMLVDEGKLAWDDPVRKHVPFFRLHDPLADGQVTLRDLLCHRTGVGSHDLLSYRAPWGLEEQIRRIGLVKPSQPFRSSFQYQNIMFIAAGHAVGTASGTKWGDFVQQRIFVPLQMNDSSVTTTALLKTANYAHSHRRNRDGKIEVIPWYRYDEPNPALSINSSARDLAKWLQFQLGDGTFKVKENNGEVQRKTLVSTRNLVETHMPQTIIRLEDQARLMHPFTTQMSYGMGWVIQDYHGLLLNSHGGVIDGQRAHITLVPSERVGLAILTNLHLTRMNLALSNLILDRLFGFPFKDWHGHYQDLIKAEEAAEKAYVQARRERRQPDTRPSHELQAYTGTYEDPAYGPVRITLENGGLVWYWSTFRCPLEHFHYDTFTVKDELLKDPLLAFTLAADGRVDGFRMMEVDFQKVAR